MWTCAGDARVVADLVGLAEGERGGGDADPEVVARWLDDGVAPSGECGRAHGKSGVHGFDLTFCAPKSVSLVRVFGDDVLDKAVSVAHQTAIGEALEYLAAHAGYTRVHNAVTGEKTCRSCRVWWRWLISMRPRGRGSAPAHPRPGAQPAGPR